MNKKTFTNIWVIRFVSLVFAIFLYFFVSSENANVPLRGMQNQEFASVNVTETISNVPVYLGPTDGATFVSGVPETVDVRLTGPRNIINQVSSETLRVETESLTDMQPGSRAIRYLVKNLPENIDYQVTPSRTIVQISKRETLTKPVEYVIDKAALDKDYYIASVKVNPKEVTLTGNEEIIKQVDRVYINITSEAKMQKTFTGTYAIKIVDKADNLLDVNASQTDIKAEVTIVPIQKDVAINLLAKGEDTENYTYNYEFVGANKLAIASANPIQFINGIVDVTDMTESGVVNVALEIGKGMILVDPETIEVRAIIQPKSAESPESSQTSQTYEISTSSGPVKESRDETEQTNES